MSITESYRAIVEGHHNDPFSILGVHEGDGCFHLNVFLPNVERIFALVGKKRIELNRVPECHDIYTAEFQKRPKYKLIAQNLGAEWEFQDPYSFGPVIGDFDEYLAAEGTHRRLWHVLGAHVITHEKTKGVHFAVWAPNAQRVSVVGAFNLWDGRRHIMRKRGGGIWEIFVPELVEGDVYKFEIRDRSGAILPHKADPIGFGSEHAPATASVVRDLSRKTWSDQKWMKSRGKKNNIAAPISVYEVHLGSWRRMVDDGGRRLSYLEMADELVDYAVNMGFTHIEFLPISEYPFDGSWGYQPVGMFAPTIRYGTPNEFRALVNAAHLKGLGVILDWVPGHFPTDAHGLGQFDGTPLYEHADPKEGFHQDWNTLIFNYGRREVANYLTANALYWLEEYHIDALRVDAVASMIYRDYSRKDGEWIPNKDGGRENYEAIWMLQEMNRIAYGEVEGIMTIAEESTSFPGVSRPTDHGGLGFGFKWNMGWMNDTLRYMEQDPIHRKYHHNLMTFGIQYAFSENFILPISHDEVVHGKGSMIDKMPGTGEEKFANLRAYYGFMWGHPGKKLLFMGCEFAQSQEWNHDQSLDWHLLEHKPHQGMQNLVRDLNHYYQKTPALYTNDCRPEGFTWLEYNDADASIFSFVRTGSKGEFVVVVSNMTPIERIGYRVGFPKAGIWYETINTDADIYGGKNRGNMGVVKTEDKPWHNQNTSAEIYIPPLSTVIFEFKK